ncbi:peptidoglycan-binding protein [Microcystis aeruginosa]|jgi:hypothetical protein|uniref:Peptidoglycan binding-like domain-containing protein n=1 Tax=Microcystis aeruginosa FD4 TaxID=2686288 RepID=A0A857D547_MICAE|nr:peptidoglycan-binding protein [Microcystis aeruginosa]QGZ90771.1 hypothetical protein GQR42_15815 [Microcystis aeruginosa FD4]
MLEALDRGIHGYFPFSHSRRLRRDHFDDWLTDELDEAIDEILDDFEDVDQFLTASQMSRAVQRNQVLSGQLGWQSHYDAIVRFLASTGCLRPNYSPGWQDLSEAIACWQQRQGLTADGIIGRNTWGRMQSQMRMTQPEGSIPASPRGGITSGIAYEVAAGQEYGPRWRSRRPPGLPASARQASRTGAALAYIEQIARSTGLGQTFVTTVRHLAHTESKGIFARPANIFNILPPSQRQGRPYISAWGVFQFNRDAWRSLAGVSQTAFPWDSTPDEEIARPIRKYAELFSQVTRAGGSPIDAARGIRLWHMRPALYRSYFTSGQRQGFSSAWQRVDQERRIKIDRHLRNAGVL